VRARSHPVYPFKPGETSIPFVWPQDFPVTELHRVRYYRRYTDFFWSHGKNQRAIALTCNKTGSRFNPGNVIWEDLPWFQDGAV